MCSAWRFCFGLYLLLSPRAMGPSSRDGGARDGAPRGVLTDIRPSVATRQAPSRGGATSSRPQTSARVCALCARPPALAGRLDVSVSAPDTCRPDVVRPLQTPPA